MPRECLHVNTLLKLKPGITDQFYGKLPTYEDPMEMKRKMSTEPDNREMRKEE